MTKTWRTWALPTAILAALAVLAAGVVAVRGTSDGSTRLAAYFIDVAALIPGNNVRANGVKVGQVVDVRLENGMARVEMELEPDALPLHEDASARIRPVSLLGERFVDLDTGSANLPLLREPPTIPLERTSASVDLDEIINELDTPTSTALGALVTALGEGMEGNGENTAAAIAALVPALRDAHQLAEVLSEQNAVLDDLIEQAAPVAAAVARQDGETVDQLVASAHRTLGAVAAHRTALDQALTRLPQTLRDVRVTLEQLSGVADATTPALRSVRPVTDNLTAIGEEIDAFAASGGPALASLRPVLEHAEALLAQARPVVGELRGGSGELRDVAAAANPLGTAVLDNLDNLLRFITGWALATAGYDAIGHYFRATVPIDANTIKLIAPDLVPPELFGESTVPGDEDLTQPVVTEVPGLPLPDPAQLPLDGALELGSATGLNQAQELSLLGQLLGGG